MSGLSKKVVFEPCRMDKVDSVTRSGFRIAFTSGFATILTSLRDYKKENQQKPEPRRGDNIVAK